MFDDRIYDNILEEMLDGFGKDVDTGEASLAYNACDKIAEKLEETYGDMDAINRNMSPDTMDLDHLIQYGELQRGVSYNYATAPVVKGEFQQEIEIGQQFICNDFTYTVSEVINGFTYKLTCDTEGVEANTNLGELTPADYIDDYKGGEITEILRSGTNDEEEEEYRKRVLLTFKSKAFGGNIADYREKVDGLDGVGGCKPKRRDRTSSWIYITIIGNDFGVPSQEIVKRVQDAIDPEQSHGEGDGIANICHNVLSQAVEAVPVSVSVKVVWDSGYSADTSKSRIEAAIQEYLLTIRKSWESSKMNNQYIRISQVEARILSVEGVIDVTETKLNDKEENVTLIYTQIPTFGGVTIV